MVLQEFLLSRMDPFSAAFVKGELDEKEELNK
jgi:hypothetical protein